MFVNVLSSPSLEAWMPVVELVGLLVCRSAGTQRDALINNSYLLKDAELVDPMTGKYESLNM